MPYTAQSRAQAALAEAARSEQWEMEVKLLLFFMGIKEIVFPHPNQSFPNETLDLVQRIPIHLGSKTDPCSLVHRMLKRAGLAKQR